MPLQLLLMARATAAVLRMGMCDDAICFSSYLQQIQTNSPHFCFAVFCPVFPVCSVRSVSYIRLHHFDQDYIDWRDDVR